MLALVASLGDEALGGSMAQLSTGCPARRLEPRPVVIALIGAAPCWSP
jgi:hypothetical protein